MLLLTMNRESSGSSSSRIDSNRRLGFHLMEVMPMSEGEAWGRRDGSTTALGLRQCFDNN